VSSGGRRVERCALPDPFPDFSWKPEVTQAKGQKSTASEVTRSLGLGRDPQILKSYLKSFYLRKPWKPEVTQIEDLEAGFLSRWVRKRTSVACRWPSDILDLLANLVRASRLWTRFATLEGWHHHSCGYPSVSFSLAISPLKPAPLPPLLSAPSRHQPWRSLHRPSPPVTNHVALPRRARPCCARAGSAPLRSVPGRPAGRFFWRRRCGRTRDPARRRAASCPTANPPWRQPRGRWIVSSVSSHTHATRIGWHLWETDLRCATGLPPGWSCPTTN